VGHHYHIETDGEVYLIRDGERLRFPTSLSEVPFDVAERFSYDALVGETVTVCRPHLDEHPTDWVYKDDIPERTDIDIVVQKAINVSLPRCVVGLAIPRGPLGEREVLMVKSARGMTTGMWNIPGGFVEFNEHPEAAASREGEEELGVVCRPGRLLGVYSELFDKPGHAHHLYGFMYECTIESEDLRLAPDEIADATWMPLAEAIRSTRNPFAIQAFQILLDEEQGTTPA
jgi:8-oxo-dGTP pyrophosphatase MutT (NUDIX family)